MECVEAAVTPQCRFVLLSLAGRVIAPGERLSLETDAGAESLADPAARHTVLLDPVSAIRPEPGKRYPIVLAQLHVYAQLSGGSGPHRLSVEMLRWYQGQPFTVFRTPDTPLDFGRDRAAAAVYRVLLKPVIFPTAGQYTFRVWCDGTPIGHAELELETPP
jgi:hypothetical protein